MTKLREGIARAWNHAREWLTDARRQAVHAALGTIATLAVTVGWLNDGQSTALIGLAGSALALAQGVLGLSLLTRSDAARWFGTVGRGLVYGFAAAGGAAGVALGIWGGPDVETFLPAVAAGLTVLSALVAVVNVQTAPTSTSGTLMTRRAYRATLEG